MSEWISVKDRLPEKMGRYLVWFAPNGTDGWVGGVPKGRESVIYWSKDGWTKPSGNRANDAFDVVTHWQPLPAPPEGA